MAKEAPKGNPEISSPNEKTITIDEKNGTTGHIAAELRVSMKWLQGILGNYSEKPKTLVAGNYLTPGKGESKYEERYWSEPRIGDKYISKVNEDPTTGATLIRIRGKETISMHIPPEALNKKMASIDEIKGNVLAQIEQLQNNMDTTQSA